MSRIDFPLLQREVLAAVRGKISQARLAQKMSSRAERVRLWESGAVTVSWGVFCRLCELQKIPLAAACRERLGFERDPRDFAVLVNHLLGKDIQAAVASRLGVSRSMVSRWRSGRSEPSLEQMLRMAHGSFFSLAEFLAFLVPPALLPSLAAEISRERRERELHYRYPWVAALLLFLRTLEYNELGCHREGYHAARLGIPVETEVAVMKELLELGVIEREGQIFAPTLRTLSTAGDREGNRRIREYWGDRAQKRIRQGMVTPPESRWGYMLLNVNPATRKKLEERYLAFFHDVHSIVQEGGAGSEDVYLLNVQLLNVEDLPS